MDIGATLGGTEAAEMTSPVVRPTERSGPVSPKANPNHTPPRSVRVPDDLWEAARFLTGLRGETITDVVNVALAQYVLDGLAERGGVIKPVDRAAVKRTIPETELRRIIMHVVSRRPGADISSVMAEG